MEETTEIEYPQFVLFADGGSSINRYLVMQANLEKEQCTCPLLWDGECPGCGCKDGPVVRWSADVFPVCYCLKCYNRSRWNGHGCDETQAECSDCGKQTYQVFKRGKTGAPRTGSIQESGPDNADFDFMLEGQDEETQQQIRNAYNKDEE